MQHAGHASHLHGRDWLLSSEPNAFLPLATALAAHDAEREVLSGHRLHVVERARHAPVALLLRLHKVEPRMQAEIAARGRL